MIALLIYGTLILLLFNDVTSYPEYLIQEDEFFYDYLRKLQEDNQMSANKNKLIESSASLWRMSGTIDELLQFQSRIMKSYMVETANPCDDFYQYACGNWDKIHPIPKDNSAYNIFSMLSQNLLDAVNEILSKKMAENLTSFQQLNAEDKSKLFYTDCLDLATINQRGSEPLLNFIDSLGGWPVLDENWNETNCDLVKLFAKTTTLGNEHFLNLGVEIDLKNTNRYAIYFEEIKLGLENREDFLQEENAAHLTAYKNLIITILTLLDVDHDKADEVANEIINFEIELANITSEERSNMSFYDHYVGTTLDELAKNYTGINLIKFVNLVLGRNLSSDQFVVLFSNPDFDKMIELIINTDKKILANYVIWRNVQQVYRHLDERFLSAGQTFDEALTGQKEPTAHKSKCADYTNDKMGMAVGAQFVREYFDENSKRDVEQLTEKILNSFRDTLENLDWLDDDTRQKSLEKVNAMKLTVGYPDFILSPNKLDKYYSSVIIEKGKHFENVIRLNMFEIRRNFKNLDKKVDKEKWPAYPAIINAFFEPTKNRIIIPVGVLQPPIYHKYFPKALNYGGIGVFVGHELTHGFDDAGREFDSNGNMNRWWNDVSIDKFSEKTDCFIDQYNNYSLHGKYLSGEATKSENIADNGGIRQAFSAYKKWLETASDEDLAKEHIPDLNLTNEQLYFLGFAQVWCGNIRSEAIENIIATDAHCPGQYRVQGSLSNFDEFSKAFKCSPQQNMNPEKKCRLW